VLDPSTDYRAIDAIAPRVRVSFRSPRALVATRR
jgi:hypothetical protein